jgi:hypothetical protein
METDDMDLDTLARMVAEGFLGIDKRFEILEGSMNDRFESLEESMNGRFEKLEIDLEVGLRAVNKRLDSVVELLDDHSTRIKDLELAR